jgi:hypothetical protein
LSPCHKAILLAAAAPFLASCAFLIGLDEPTVGEDGTSDAADAADAADADQPDMQDGEDADLDDGDVDLVEDNPPDAPPDVDDGVDEADVDAGETTVIFGNTPDADFPETILDTFINLDHSNACTDSYLATYTWPDASVANAVIIAWDLSALPENATVTDAVLQLYLCSLDGTGGVALRRVHL